MSKTVQNDINKTLDSNNGSSHGVNMQDLNRMNTSADIPDINSQNVDSENLPNTIAHIPVMEKIIFCIDTISFSTKQLIERIKTLIDMFYNMKKMISNNSPIEFQIIYLTDNDIQSSKTFSLKKYLTSNLSKLKPHNVEQTEYDFSKLFHMLAHTLQLPDEQYYPKPMTPPYIYHMILLFGHDKYIPVLNETNPYDFVTSSPFFYLDIVYLYDDSSESQLYQTIGQALSGLINNKKGKYFSASKNDNLNQLYCVARTLGHPLIRF